MRMAQTNPAMQRISMAFGTNLLTSYLHGIAAKGAVVLKPGRAALQLFPWRWPALLEGCGREGIERRKAHPQGYEKSYHLYLLSAAIPV
jgi:hypothetical protein